MSEQKLLPFSSDVKLDYQGRTIEGYAAAFGNIDLVNDILHRGSCSKTIQERGPGKIKFLWQHDTKQPLGRILEMNEDGKGLFFKAVISDTQTGRDALALLRDGAIDGMSIGYDPIVHDYSKVEGKTVRNLREIKLYEISLCTLQANPEAQVTALKEKDDYRPVDEKPYPSEHAARIKDPNAFIPDSFRRRTITEGIDAIFGKLKDGDGAMVLQAYRFDKERYSAAQARAWLREHDAKPIEFEPASEADKAEGEDYPWDECVAEQTERYGDEETARRVCGYIRRRFGKAEGSKQERLAAIYPDMEADLEIKPKRKADDEPEEVKAGRVLAKRNAERLRAIFRLVKELEQDGGLAFDEDDETEAPVKVRAAEDKPSTDGKPDAKAEPEMAAPEAGPDTVKPSTDGQAATPPTFDIRALELEIETESLRLLEV